MIKKYGDFSKISENLESIIELLSKKLEEDNIDAYIYYGYPIKNEDGKTQLLKLIIVSERGIFNFLEENDTKSMFRNSVQQKLFAIDSIADKIDEGIEVCKHIKINNLENFNFISFSKVLTEQEIKKFNAMFQNATSLQIKDNRIVINDNTLGSIIKKRNNKLSEYDETQFSTIYSNNNDTNLRIRGLAGSGKTVILVKKMAYMHYRNPDLKMVYVFYTISLKQYIQNLFEKFYREFDVNKEINYENISFVHGWGSKKYSGFYSHICDLYEIDKEPLHNFSRFGNPFEEACTNLIVKLNEKNPEKLGLYDYVFIDEAQDFPLSFYKLVQKSLNANGKLIYAYDELQTLFGTKVPSKHEIFGDEICNDISLKICYRTPKEILVTAHALGMGIYKEGGNVNDLVNIPVDLSIWDAIGYKSLQKIEYGSLVSLFRDPTNIDITCENSIEFKQYSSKEEQYRDISKILFDLIQHDDVLTEDIMIIDLESGELQNNFFEFKKILTNYLNVAYKGKERKIGLNLIDKDNAYDFKIKNSISYTTIFRAKGNEANIVFIVNADKMLSLSSYNRNRLFTAMTRAKFKVYISGLQKVEQYIKEYEKVKELNYKLEFMYPTLDQLETIRTMAMKEERDASAMTKAVDLAKNLKENNKEAYIELLLNQTGCTSIEQLKKELELLSSTNYEE